MDGVAQQQLEDDELPQQPEDDLALLPKKLHELSQAKAREKFAVYREYVHPDLIQGWWTEDVSKHLQQFYQDLVAGKRPKLMITAHPQSGKTRAVEDFICWVTGNNPNLKTIYASYSDELGTGMNLALQRTLKSERYREVFGKLAVGQHGWQCNTSDNQPPNGHLSTGQQGQVGRAADEGRLTRTGITYAFRARMAPVQIQRLVP